MSDLDPLAEPNDGDYDEVDDAPFCFRCQNSGSVPCRCGGDQCYCSNYGELPCPSCDRYRY